MKTVRPNLIMLAIAIVCAAFAIAPSPQQRTFPNDDTMGAAALPLTAYRLPDTLSFCGEIVPLDQPHIRERAEREFYLMLQDPGQLIINIKRSGIYFPLFDSIALADTVPSDLKYIAVIESALRNARSSKEAYGIWQFIESTGKRMGLEINKEVDERLNVAKATHAAYSYLKEGYATFHSWTMAAAGYNMGHEFLGAEAAYQHDNNFYQLYLNEETSRYIFRIAVMKEIMQHPNRYGLYLRPEDKYAPDNLQTVIVKDGIPDLEEWALQNGTTYRWVKFLNPWILSKHVPAPSGNSYAIVIPQGF